MNSVIQPLLVVGLIGALVGHAFVSGVLVVKLGRFDDAQRTADEADLGPENSGTFRSDFLS